MDKNKNLLKSTLIILFKNFLFINFIKIPYLRVLVI
jgi:hypothetical protein